MLEIVNLVKTYGSFTALNSLNLTVNDGSIFGFVGPNGAGKTTTMKIIAGLLSPTSGMVKVNDIDVTKSPRALREKIGYMPDFFGVYDNLKVSEYMDFYAAAYYLPQWERGQKLDSLLELVDLADKKNTYVDSLSRGMKQRLCLARSLIHDPEVLILDEPASGLDPRARVEIKTILKQLGTLGKTVIISSHILMELAELCTTVGIIDKGKMVAQGSVDEIMRSLSRERRIFIKLLEKNETLLNILEGNSEVSVVSEKVLKESYTEVEFGFSGDDRSLARLIAEAVAKGAPVLNIRENEGNLEEIYMQLTDGSIA